MTRPPFAPMRPGISSQRTSGQSGGIANPGTGHPRTSAGRSQPRPVGAPGYPAPTATVHEAAAKFEPYSRGQRRHERAFSGSRLYA